MFLISSKVAPGKSNSLINLIFLGLQSEMFFTKSLIFSLLIIIIFPSMRLFNNLIEYSSLIQDKINFYLFLLYILLME